MDENGDPIPEVDDHGYVRRDEDGNIIYKTKEVQYKYRTPEMDLDLEAVDVDALEHVLTDADLNKSKQDVKDLVNLYQQNELRIEKLKNEIESIREIINNIAVSVGGTPVKRGRQTRNALLAIDEKTARITRIIAANGNIEAEIIRLRKDIQDNESNEAHNDGVRRSVMKRNADKVNSYFNDHR